MFQRKSTTLKSSTDTLIEKSRSITELFTKAIFDYEAVNEQATVGLAEKEELIKQAEAEKIQLEKLIASNTKVVGNLKKIFE